MKSSCFSFRGSAGILMVIGFAVLISCRESDSVAEPEAKTLKTDARFTLLPPESTGITFSNFANNFKEDYNYNIFIYEYMYNGGGVATGDVNGDNLPDLYFTSTFGSDKLYINLGDFKFLDVTDKSGVGAKAGFKTGTTMADINADGKLDIYVCRTSKTDDGQKSDHVYINIGNKMENGNAIPLFEDQTKTLGLEDNSNSNHATFFDYDRDGDLDLFLLNHRLDFKDAVSLRVQRDPDGVVRRAKTTMTPVNSNIFYKNDNGHFKVHTREAGLEGSAFGLSTTAADLNQDGWMDLYVANDYIEPDRIYINNRNGTFTDRYFEYLKHSSQNSMGSDVADINNDGLVDIIVLDMKAEDPIRYKNLINVMSYDRYNLLVQYGYGRQVGRNVLQLNNGNNTFSEIGQFAGVDATDWSWGALIADFDNDGWKDIYIANGYRRDVTNSDYMNYVRDSLDRTGGLTPRRFPDINTVLSLIPEEKIQNYLYINNKNLSFSHASKEAGMDTPSFSNGASYADLDQDGDLDLIVNNILNPAFIYRNDIDGKNWLQIDVQPKNGNTEGIGTIVDLYAAGNHQHQMLITNKGFFSSSEPILHFGLGAVDIIDSILLQWPDGQKEIMKSVTPNQRIIWKPGTGNSYKGYPGKQPSPLFSRAASMPDWTHQENDFVDFKRERLLPYMLSAEGPCLAVGDINGDQLEDIFAGNGSGFPAVFFIQKPDNSFSKNSIPVFVQDTVYEDCGSQFGDFDGDGDLDLIVISGGNSFNPNDLEYMTRLYVNDGKGSFHRSADFPIVRTNAGAVLAIDIDQDKDKDLFIAGRCTPGKFPYPPKSYFLKNNNGRFVDVTAEAFPEFAELGMITDMESADLDGDGRPEVIIAGEWIPLTVFSFDGKKFSNETTSYGLEKTSGWWKSITIDDLDGDGDADLLAGNLGLNHRMHTSDEYPVTLIANDFDDNGSMDPVLCFYHEQKLYPFAGRDAIIGQLPVLKKKFTRYTPYAYATIEDILPEDKLDESTSLQVYTFKTMYFRNDQKKFVPMPLPYQVQLSPVLDIVTGDFNHDGKKDILMAGNFLYSETETSEMDAGNGALLLQTDDGSFRYVPNIEHGFWAQGEVRELKKIRLANGKEAVLTGNNRGPVEINLIAN